MIRSDEGLALETSAPNLSYGGKPVGIINQFEKNKYL